MIRIKSLMKILFKLYSLIFVLTCFNKGFYTHTLTHSHFLSLSLTHTHTHTHTHIDTHSFLGMNEACLYEVWNFAP